MGEAGLFGDNSFSGLSGPSCCIGLAGLLGLLLESGELGG